MGMNAFGYPIAEEEYFDEEDIALSASTSLEVFSRLDFVPCENARNRKQLVSSTHIMLQYHWITTTVRLTDKSVVYSQAPSSADLMTLIAKKIPTKWYEVGVLLDILKHQHWTHWRHRPRIKFVSSWRCSTSGNKRERFPTHGILSSVLLRKLMIITQLLTLENGWIKNSTNWLLTTS